MRSAQSLIRACAVALLLAGSAQSALAQFITGKLVDQQSNRPIEGATVTLLAASGSRELDRIVTTNKHGTFMMRVEQGRYRLGIKRLAFAPLTTDIIAMEPGKSVTLNYTLTPVTIRLATVHVVDRSGLERGRDGMAKREAMGTGGVFLYAKDFAEKVHLPVWEIVGAVDGLRPRLDGSIESLRGNYCLQFLLNRLPITELPMQWVDLNKDLGKTFASVYEMLPDGLDIAGVEVYRQFSEVPEELRQDAWPDPAARGVTPIRYVGSIRKNIPLPACGLVAFWTKGAW